LEGSLSEIKKMNPWKTLNIDPTNDKKVIKKAYAILIKQYKPDEYPEKFQEIQQAYQIALSSLQFNLNKIEIQEQPITIKETEKEKTITEEFELTQNQTIDTEEDIAFQKQQQELIDNLYKNLHEMAFAPLVVKNKLENWKFIEDFYQIDDLSIKEEVAKSVLKKVAEYNLYKKNSNNTLLINADNLTYLNDIFDWSTQWNEYQYIFPDHYFEVTLDPINQKIKLDSWLDSIQIIIKRSIGFTLEILLYLGIFYLINKLFSTTYNFYPKILWIMFYMMAGETLFGNKNSFGNDIFDLIVLDQFGNTCSKFQSIVRVFLFFILVLIPLYVWYNFDIFNINLFIIYCSIIFSIYATVFVFTKKLFHDFLTNTVVVRQF